MIRSIPTYRDTFCPPATSPRTLHSRVTRLTSLSLSLLLLRHWYCSMPHCHASTKTSPFLVDTSSSKFRRTLRSIDLAAPSLLPENGIRISDERERSLSFFSRFSRTRTMERTESISNFQAEKRKKKGWVKSRGRDPLIVRAKILRDKWRGRSMRASSSSSSSFLLLRRKYENPYSRSEKISVI